ncbi:MAG: hypothetical protein HY556_06580 [Euryarchaeota archaeon]|nr:hypothetical protein [Euryarchaeota archaeon]
MPDHPTYVNLTSDTVNAANKTKYAGQELTTRVTVEDGNGLSGLRLTFTYRRHGAGLPGGVVDVERREIDDIGRALLPNATSAQFEDAFILSPLAAGNYSVTASVNTTSVTRTFRILDSRPFAKPITALDVVATENGIEAHGLLEVGDKNFGTGPLDSAGVPGLPDIIARLYRGSNQVNASMWTTAAIARSGEHAPFSNLSLATEPTTSTRFVTVKENGTGFALIPFELQLSPGLASGTYRLSIYETDPTGAAGNLLTSVDLVVPDAGARLDASIDTRLFPPGGTLNVTISLPEDAASVEWAISDVRDAGFGLSGAEEATTLRAAGGRLTLEAPPFLSETRTLELRLSSISSNGTRSLTWQTEIAVADSPLSSAVEWHVDSKRREGSEFQLANLTTHMVDATVVLKDDNWEAPDEARGSRFEVAVVDWEGRGRAWPVTMAANSSAGSTSVALNLTVPANEEGGRYEVRFTLAGSLTATGHIRLGAWVSLEANRTRMHARTGDDRPTRLTVDVPLTLGGGLADRRLEITLSGNDSSAGFQIERVNGTAQLVDSSGERLTVGALAGGRATLALPQYIDGEIVLSIDVDTGRPLKPGTSRFTLTLEVTV